MNKLMQILRSLAAWFRHEAPVALPQAEEAPFAANPQIESCELEASSDEIPKERRKSLRGLRREIEDAACEILGLFERAERTTNAMSLGTHTNAHDDLWACDFHYVDVLSEKTQGHSKYYLMDDQCNQAEAVWPVDVACISYKEHSNGYFTSRVTTASPSDVRGKTSIVPQRVVIFSGGYLTEDTKWWAENTICGLVGGRWKDIGNTVLKQRQTGIRGDTHTICRAPANRDEVNDTISVQLSLALTERYSWHVAFGNINGPRLLLPTNPTGCVALFKDREKPEDGRRAALRHWVSNHYRDASRSDSDIIYVCDHLRGCTMFEWRGLQCEILVSQFDLEKNEMFKNQAAEWRAQRKHNRVRLKFKERRRAGVST